MFFVLLLTFIIQLADEAPEPASDDDKKKKSPDDVSNDKLIKAKKAKGKGKK
jgi:replication factor C subunit 1